MPKFVEHSSYIPLEQIGIAKRTYLEDDQASTHLVGFDHVEKNFLGGYFHPEHPCNPELGTHLVVRYTANYSAEGLIQRYQKRIKTLSELKFPRDYHHLRMEYLQLLAEIRDELIHNPELANPADRIVLIHEDEHVLQQIRFQALQLIQEVACLNERFFDQSKQNSVRRAQKHGLVLSALSEAQAFLTQLTLNDTASDLATLMMMVSLHWGLELLTVETKNRKAQTRLNRLTKHLTGETQRGFTKQTQDDYRLAFLILITGQADILDRIQHKAISQIELHARLVDGFNLALYEFETWKKTLITPKFKFDLDTQLHQTTIQLNNLMTSIFD